MYILMHYYLHWLITEHKPILETHKHETIIFRINVLGMLTPSINRQTKNTNKQDTVYVADNFSFEF